MLRSAEMPAPLLVILGLRPSEKWGASVERQVASYRRHAADKFRQNKTF